eukprot:scaffold322233_cov33-Prasinocladus_malaysianus.AAC.1
MTNSMQRMLSNALRAHLKAILQSQQSMKTNRGAFAACSSMTNEAGPLVRQHATEWDGTVVQ